MDNKKLQFDDIFDQSVEDTEKTIISAEEELDVPEMKVDVNIQFDKVESVDDETDFTHDMQYLRTKLLNSIEQADQILQSLLKRIIIDDTIAADSTPQRGYYRYYEVSSQILKQICDASKELVNLHTSNTKIKKEMGWNQVVDNKECKNGKEKIVNTLQDVVNGLKGVKNDE